MYSVCVCMYVRCMCAMRRATGRQRKKRMVCIVCVCVYVCEVYVCSEESNWSEEEEEDGTCSVRVCSVRACMCAVRRATGQQRKRRMVCIVCVRVCM